ncbi:MAG: tetratricopeptide repeat protein [Myxococcota bacterium]
MYNLLISLAISAGLFGAVAVFLGWQPAILPALFAFPVLMFFLARRTGASVQAAMEPLQAMLSTPVQTPAEQQQRLREADGLLVTIQKTYGGWQFLISDQLDNQRGMLRYMSKNFDEALPLLQKGWWRDWMSQAAEGCIHIRNNDADKAWEAFEAAASSSKKELMVYVLWGTLAAKAGDHEQAVKAFSSGLENLENHSLLKELKNHVANKEAIPTEKLPDAWYTTFFPEELERLMKMRGGRGVHPVVQRLMEQQGVDPRQVARQQQARPMGRGTGKRSRRR